MRVKIKPEIAAMEFETAHNESDCYRIKLPSGRPWYIPKDCFDLVPEPWKVGDKAIDSDGDECVIVAIVRNVAGVDYGETSRMGPMFWNLSDITRPTTEQP